MDHWPHRSIPPRPCPRVLQGFCSSGFCSTGGTEEPEGSRSTSLPPKAALLKGKTKSLSYAVSTASRSSKQRQPQNVYIDYYGEKLGIHLENLDTIKATNKTKKPQQV